MIIKKKESVAVVVSIAWKKTR